MSRSPLRLEGHLSKSSPSSRRKSRRPSLRILWFANIRFADSGLTFITIGPRIEAYARRARPARSRRPALLPRELKVVHFAQAEFGRPDLNPIFVRVARKPLATAIR